MFENLAAFLLKKSGFVFAPFSAEISISKLKIPNN